VERNWQYFIYFFAGAALIAFLARRRGGGGNLGLGMIVLAIFIVLGVLLLVNALSRPA
jgi:formate-dependent nitrite reductase membrane component NrfD